MCGTLALNPTRDIKNWICFSKPWPTGSRETEQSLQMKIIRVSGKELGVKGHEVRVRSKRRGMGQAEDPLSKDSCYNHCAGALESQPKRKKDEKEREE